MMETVWLESVVQHQPKRWLPGAYSSYDELLAAAVEAAGNSPDAPARLELLEVGRVQSGGDPESRARPGFHFCAVGPARGSREQSGSPFTVKAVSPTNGPSERITVDLADLDQSTINLVTGESGNFLSPNYLDQWNAWYENSTFPWPFSSQATQKANVHQFVPLQPEN